MIKDGKFHQQFLNTAIHISKHLFKLDAADKNVMTERKDISCMVKSKNVQHQ